MRFPIKTALVATLLAAGTLAMALGPGGGRMAKDLGLTPEQQQKMKDLRTTHQQEVSPIREQIKAKMLDIRLEMEKDAPDTGVLDRLVGEAETLKASLHKARLHHLLDLKKILTPEQWQKAREHFLAQGGRDGEGERHGRGERGSRGRCGSGAGHGHPGHGPGPDGPPGMGDEHENF
jgi:Spy/CpxP family protein refolding chaperone